MAEYVSFSSRLFSFLSLVEKIALAVAFTGIGFKYLHLTGANMLLMLSLTVLAGVYFLMAYRPGIKAEGDESAGQQPAGFATLLASTILPKVTSIACAVLVVGILYRLLHLTGAAEMLMIGVAAGAGAAALLGFFMATGNERAKAQVAILYRLVPILIIATYLLMPLLGKDQ